MQYKYYICDVFTETRFGGNPLAVLPNAEGLTTEQMQKIATEFNFSESTFVFPAEQGNTRKVRIFTPTIEVPFAGHPNIGTAFTLATIGEFGDLDEVTEIVFEEKAGLVPITIRNEVSKPIWSELKAPEALSIGKSVSTELIAEVLSLKIEDIVTDTHMPQVASVGLPFLIIELRTRQALEQANINLIALDKIVELGITPDIHIYFHIYSQSNDDFDLRTRMFAPLDGVVEDPATGSANCALVGMLSHYDGRADGDFSWRIAQGVEMGRESVLEARASKMSNEVVDVWIAGRCVMVAEGTITLE